MGRSRQQVGVKRTTSVRIVEHIQPLDPGLAVAGSAHHLMEHARHYRVRVVIVNGAGPHEHDALDSKPARTPIRLNFESVPLLLNTTALTFSASGRSKNPEGICFSPPTMSGDLSWGDDEMPLGVMPPLAGIADLLAPAVPRQLRRLRAPRLAPA